MEIGLVATEGLTKARVGFLALVLSVGLGWSLWLPTFWKQRSRVNTDWWTQPLSMVDLSRLSADWVMSERVVPQHSPWIALAVGCVMAIVVARLVWMRLAFTSYLATVIVVSVLVAIGCSWVGSNVIVSRYFAAIHLLWLIGLATALASLRTRVLRHCILATATLFSIGVHVVEIERENAKERRGIRDAVAWVENRISEEDVVVVDSSLIYFPASYHATDRARWRLLESVNGVSFSTGLPVLRESDRMEIDLIRERHHGTLWCVSTGSQRMFVPDEPWEPTGREFFDGTLPFQETLIVTTYRRAEGVDSTDAVAPFASDSGVLP